MEEKIFFDQNGVSVSNARFIVNGQTYAMNGVTSVKQMVVQPSRAAPLILAIVGLVALATGSSGGIFFGLVLLAAAGLWLAKQKPQWIVALHSSSGEAQALKSDDKAYIGAVIDALNQSIVHRG